MKEKIFYLGFTIFLVLLIIVFEFFFPCPKDVLMYIANFLSAGALCVVYIIFGLKLAEIFNIKKKSLKYIYGFLLSVIFFGTLIFIVGFFKLYNFYFFYFLTVILILVSIKELKEFLNDCKYLLLKINVPLNINLKDIIFCIVIGFLILYSFIAIMTPPVYYDELVYHLGLPAQYIAEGGIFNIKNNIFFYFPALMQMNYMYFLIFSGDIGIKILQLLIYIITLFIVLNMTDKVDASGKWVLFLLLSFPLFLLNSIRLTAELPFTIFILAILNFILEKDKNYQLIDIVFIGIISGAILSVKYTGFIIYFFILIYFFNLLVKKQIKIKYFLLYSVTPFSILLPYLVKNYFFIGNPVYPFLTGIFNTGILKEEADKYIFHLNNFGIEKNIFNFILSPFYIVFKREFFGGDILTPIFIISLLCVFFTLNSRTRLLWFFILFYYTIWFYTSQVLRFLLPACVILIIITGIILKRYNGNLLKISFLFLILFQIFTGFYFIEKYLSPFELFVYKREKYISKRISYYNAAQFLNKNNIDKKAVLLLGDARVFYFKHKVFTNTVFNKNDLIEIFKYKDEKSFIEILKKNNIKYIITNLNEIERLKTSGFGEINSIINSEKFKNFIDINTEKIYSDNDCVIYLLNI